SCLLLKDSKKSKKKALSRVGYVGKEEIKKYILSGGDGVWPTPHLVSKLFIKKAGEWKPRTKKFIPYGFLADLIRYQKKENKVSIGVGKQKDKFDKKLGKVARDMEKGDQQKVTDRQRRLFGAVGGLMKKKYRQIGVNFFPLTKKLKYLRRPGRSLQKAGRKVLRDSPKRFEKKYLDSFSQRNFLVQREDDIFKRPVV
ncbi:hypothetical protein DRH14_03955, partial [Candidatus Shapirobacteria bacterium]